MTIKFTPDTPTLTFRVPVTLHRNDLPLAIVGWALNKNSEDQTASILDIASPNLTEVEAWVRDRMAVDGQSWSDVVGDTAPETLVTLGTAIANRLFPVTPTPPIVSAVPDPEPSVSEDEPEDEGETEPKGNTENEADQEAQ